MLFSFPSPTFSITKSYAIFGRIRTTLCGDGAALSDQAQCPGATLLYARRGGFLSDAVVVEIAARLDLTELEVRNGN